MENHAQNNRHQPLHQTQLPQAVRKYIATRDGVEKPIPKQETNRELDREIFINYLDSRLNSHGLFSETDDPLVLDKVAKEAANHPGALWTHIVSLKREDA